MCMCVHMYAPSVLSHRTDPRLKVGAEAHQVVVAGVVCAAVAATAAATAAASEDDYDDDRT